MTEKPSKIVCIIPENNRMKSCLEVHILLHGAYFKIVEHTTGL